ncbi:YCII-related protein [Halothece sp. PCC 7418]|uniref:YciI family protein n=1 Tax=Halothece sp. (strain PCC 7418) TaxID=65093 RepID=UPI0002A064D6|nr:YciI family protein [Halothece sp. PCC 7418]AFZ43241.1 YCII-related protein [Halothece sp. PCC 7418]
MPLFVKIEKGIVEKPIFDQYVPAHIDYVKQLVTQGYKARSGYWGDFGGGMLLFEADSLEEAQKIVENDPLVKNDCVTYELHEWCIVVE